ncbi:MAG: phenylalanine--tRNA ligase subunit alpha [Rickettsiales bacterium]|nr:phenylalanine--tRNA ligase subunit alpha [Rickettsiales bacterium]
MLEQITKINSLEELQALYSGTFGKNGTMTIRLKDMKNLDNDARVALNSDAAALRDAFKARELELEHAVIMAGLESKRLDAAASFDTPKDSDDGRIHPLTQSLMEISTILSGMGYGMRIGPEIEDDWHNFTALNTAPHHPARDMQDTFFVQGGNLLRSHTSAVQIRSMEKEGVPIKIFCPGTVYRREFDATHFPSFHQIEGLCIGKNVTLSDFISELKTILQRFFETDDVPLRIRPSYFPFTEPSVEIDVQWDRKTGAIGCGADWLELVPGGMVHPNVLRNVGVDPNEYQGFAFGFGWDRLAMLKYGFSDGRKLSEGDARWLRANGF